MKFAPLKQIVTVKEGKSVADMQLGESGVIKKLLQHAASMKLLEMGCVPGTEISLCFKTSSGGSLCIDMSGHRLSLRKEEARLLSLVE